MSENVNTLVDETKQGTKEKAACGQLKWGRSYVKSGPTFATCTSSPRLFMSSGFDKRYARYFSLGIKFDALF